MTGELGQLSLSFALALALVMAVSGLMGTRPTDFAARRIAAGSAMGLLVFVALAFGTLTYAFIISDFSVLDVASNSHTLKPLVYKISGVWANHEGSMLLWILVLSVFAALDSCPQRGRGRQGE
jgi:cytochrome c-type biogenesis protein CcmF